jgi:hypothetical protein
MKGERVAAENWEPGSRMRNDRVDVILHSKVGRRVPE